MAESVDAYTQEKSFVSTSNVCMCLFRYSLLLTDTGDQAQVGLTGSIAIACRRCSLQTASGIRQIRAVGAAIAAARVSLVLSILNRKHFQRPSHSGGGTTSRLGRHRKSGLVNSAGQVTPDLQYFQALPESRASSTSEKA